MKLQKGITGFDTTPNYTTEDLEKILKGIKYPFTKTEVVLKMNDSSNFYQIKINYQKTKQDFYLIVNSTYLIFACVEKNRCFDLKFIDFPIELISQLKSEVNSSLILLNPKELNKKVDVSDLELLGESEIKQINYWKSKTLGEIVFNCFD
ncbi:MULTISPECIES: hypothetical protein [Empedobacter]|uniref:hypothetical protein n=1 Tax=Empedobacter TaxID=59734 RepID=UPI001C59F6E8|nr:MULTISPECIES: hypothetical protein [Empedobacter]MBW1619097.1 hypothetical protein [Empedobacter falsenii]MBY0066163.1 hypothetical protein [Empedobacter falsenii]MDH0674745.1 hypothetical protein [Empedobacter sp. GD03861]MDH1603803.1 hypothetical protein [Empedobacter sp. GD03739]